MFRRRRRESVRFMPNARFWEVRCRERYDELLVRLASILPPGLTLFVEGSAMAPLIQAYLEARPAASPTVIRSGTLWPRLRGYHMPMTEENMAGLAQLMGLVAEPEVGDHLHAYRGEVAYLIWYDAFSAPLYVRDDVGEEAIRRLCEDIGGEYGRF